MKLYEKKGRRYIEIGERFDGFPADGLWLVTDGRRNSRLLLHAGEITENDQLCKLGMFLAQNQMWLAEVIAEAERDGRLTPYDLAKNIIRKLEEVN